MDLGLMAAFCPCKGGRRETGLRALQKEGGKGSQVCLLPLRKKGEWEGPMPLKGWAVIGETFPGLARARPDAGAGGVSQSELPGKPLVPVWGVQTGPSSLDLTVAMAAAGLSKPGGFHPCKYVWKKRQDRGGGARRQNPWKRQ